MSADVCLITEGSYPYVRDGLGNWTHAMIESQPDLRFHLLTLAPPRQKRVNLYNLLPNVVGVTEYEIGHLPEGKAHPKGYRTLLKQLQPVFASVMSGGRLDDLRQLLSLMQAAEGLGRRFLLNGRGMWDMLLTQYQETMPDSSFIDYFWSWRTLMSNLLSMLFSPLPEARVYHAISTGYAGLVLARAALELERPTILTEHGIYTNERRIEIAMADWLYEMKTNRLTIETIGPRLRHLWLSAFSSYSRACYEATTEIISLFEDNPAFRIDEESITQRVRLIANGVDPKIFASLSRPSMHEHVPTVALIARVIPTKDVATFIRAAALLQDMLPGLRIWVLGDKDEDPIYYEECCQLVERLKLERTLTFMGHVKMSDYLGRVDVAVLTSISESQPQAILEAGAAGIPFVATDVGACREMIMGTRHENPPLGAGGEVTSMADPAATASAIFRLLEDESWHVACSKAISERVRLYYNRSTFARTYHELYRHYIQQDNRQPGGFQPWQG